MLDEFVAVDVETTGFDAVNDRIIEIGAVRFDRGGATDRFSTFVDPGMPIPEAVRALTSIEDADVSGAPTPTRAVAELAMFAGDRPLVGHSVQFDIGFLSEAGLDTGVEAGRGAFDTYELASVLLPTAARLDLGSLAALLDVPMPVRHRALADAEATTDVFLQLLARLDELPRAALIDLRMLGVQADWPALPLFEAALARRDASVVAPPSAGLPPSAGSRSLASADLGEIQPLPPPLAVREAPRPVSAADVQALFELAQQRTDLIPGFELRSGQVQMAQAVALNLEVSGHLAVEAGTGTGKSLAYLLPLLLHAWRSGERVVVSTHTLNLQEQLATRELPAAAALVEEYEQAPAGSLRGAVLKGRVNYLCRERWAQAREDPGPRSLIDARLLARIGLWMKQTSSGDVSELYMRSEDYHRWRAFSADGNDCLTRRCAYVQDGSCFLLRARAEAAAAHLVIVNHALLLANAASDEQAMPPYRHLVIDEAHRLEAVATDQFGAAVSIAELRALTDELGASGRSGGSIAGRLAQATVRDDLPLSPAAGLGAIADALSAAAARVRDRLPDLEERLGVFIEEFAEPAARDPLVMITTGRRAQPLWGDVEEAAAPVALALDTLVGEVERARDAISMMPEGSMPHVDALRAELLRAAATAAASRTNLHEGIERSDPERIVWLASDQSRPALRLAPLEVADRLASDVYAGRASVVATSATLSTGGSFDVSVRSLGLMVPDVLDVGSPFDYRRAALALVVEDIPEPQQPGYEEGIARALSYAAQAAGGRTLALFTSHGAVRGAAAALRHQLGEQGVTVLAQGVDGSPARLLRALTEEPRSLLLGTAAFWEGIDVRGEALSQIAMARLPFPVPTDPIYAGRSALYDDPFREFGLPRAVLRFRQGFGRLIRGPDERGVFLLLDRRVLTREYGEAFLEALPDCEVRAVRTEDLGRHISEWLSG